MTGIQIAGHGGAAGRAKRRWASIGRSLRRVPLGAGWSRLRGLAGVSGLRGRVRDAGMATAEYAIATLAAVGFAGLLIVVLRSDEVRGLLTGIIRQALSV